MVSHIEYNLQRLLEEHNYNTVGNFLELYQNFKTSGCFNLKDYFQQYTPIITPEHHTCVGLALELWKKLIQLNIKFPGLTSYVYLVSCEENIETTENYVILGDNPETVATSLEKEHVLLALPIELQGRSGVLLCDPGYHIGRVITVMLDQMYPHTGCFTQSQEGNARKEYSYSFSQFNNKYIEWSEHNTNANGIQKSTLALIYTSRPYLTAVDVTERRNLVYNFRSLLSRDRKGHLNAGIYFKVKENYDEFTLFYQKNGEKKRLKYNFSTFVHSEMVDEITNGVIRECSVQLKLQENVLGCVIKSIAEVLAHTNYVKQLLEINQKINNIAEDN